MMCLGVVFIFLVFGLIDFLYLCLKGSITFGNFTPSYSSGIFSLISCFFGTPVIYFSILKVVSKLPVAQLIFLPVF